MKRLSILVSLFLLALPALAADEAAKLHGLFERSWEIRLKEDPFFATSVGRHEYNDRLPSITLADLERQTAQTKALLAELAAIDRSKLPAAEVVNYDIFQRQLENGVANFELGDYQMPFNADSGFHTGFARAARGGAARHGQGLRELHHPPEGPGRATCGSRSS